MRSNASERGNPSRDRKAAEEKRRGERMVGGGGEGLNSTSPDPLTSLSLLCALPFLISPSVDEQSKCEALESD